MARYFLTGATGFLGGHLARQLREAGHEVLALCRKPDPELAQIGVQVAIGDVGDGESVLRAAEGADGAFHCAGKVSRKLEEAEEFHRVNVEGTRVVLQACKEAKVPRLVFASSSGTVAVSTNPSHVATESDPTPIGIVSRWPYYRTKLYAEQAALAASGDGMDVVVVNPTILFGPGDVRGTSTYDIRQFLDRKVPAVPAGGLSFVDVRDAANGMLLAMTRGVPKRRYLLGACNLTLRELFARLERISGVPAPKIPLPRGMGAMRTASTVLGKLGKALTGSEIHPVSFEMAQHYWYLDASLAERELGWSPRDPMETLADTVANLGARRPAWWGKHAGLSGNAAEQAGR